MKLGEYEILGRIAVGGMAEVYRGRALGEEGFEKPVAIKRILPDYARDTRFVSMLLTEARIHAQLSHRNIVQIHDLGLSDEGEYFIVLEYVDGRDLAALLDVLSRASAPDGARMRVSDAVALHVLIELGEGAHFAHDQRGDDGQLLGLIHRDISPSNVLLSYAGEVKLADFGLAKRRTDHSVVGSLKGQLAYMSPEQARRLPLDRRSDIFALGAILFELLTGRRLREITNEVQGWQEVASGLVPSPLPFRPDLSPPVERVLAGALASDPRDRFPEARTLVTAAREALETVPRTSVGEVAELQALLHAVLPPGLPRRDTEQSKVIRLVSEFLPRDKTVRSPALGAAPAAKGRRRRTPAPVPGLTAALGGKSPTPAPRRTPPEPAPVQPYMPIGDSGPRRTSKTRTAAQSEPVPVLQPPRQGRVIALAIAAAALTLAAIVHLVFVPLPILAVWLTPAPLDVRSEPSGAEVYLDGIRFVSPTPTSRLVQRDRRPHLLELRKEGFQTVRRIIRFDRKKQMEVSLPLNAESRPSFRPMPVAPR